ncbi:poly-gamma-glutamate biosynthesis protein PgsC [Leptospira ognonensis]|uniref:Poly-gamma-glutamate biosynthesis protein PgsC n=1 Tax=Leptospira ognonensis TaxID=2484945 RepID=A0A4R9K2N3_9LEPT|nr:poly-gamma-glutamate biosynthesis protein PgsC [Leptospira ognonensis]TGL59104.1 poly-gamma-glutamate biosynthesis protein PgsC [Leptospira ognonensis]
MNDILSLSIGLSLLISLVFSELFGIVGLGLVVPGYIALHLNHPKNLLVTFSVAILAYLTVELFSYFFILFGKRKTVLILLFGYFFGYLFNYQILPELESPLVSDIRSIGFIIPGLIGIWFERQGIIETSSILIIGSVLVKILLILILGSEIT